MSSFVVVNPLPGIWSVPLLRGEIPLPSSHFTFTKVDQYRAVLFGGVLANRHRVNSYYLINLRSMVSYF